MATAEYPPETLEQKVVISPPSKKQQPSLPEPKFELPDMRVPIPAYSQEKIDDFVRASLNYAIAVAGKGGEKGVPYNEFFDGLTQGVADYMGCSQSQAKDLVRPVYWALTQGLDKPVLRYVNSEGRFPTDDNTFGKEKPAHIAFVDNSKDNSRLYHEAFDKVIDGTSSSYFVLRAKNLGTDIFAP